MKQFGKAWALPLVCAVLSFATEARAEATLTDNTWQAVDSVWGGLVTNEAHWALGHAPTTLERMRVWDNDADYTLTFPKGAHTNAAAFRIGAKHGRTVTLDGTGSTWVMPGSSDATEIYDTAPFSLFAYINGKNDASPAFGFITEKATDEYPTHAVAELSNFKITITGSASNPTMVFDGGTYDFRDPLDSAWTSTASTKPLLQIGGGAGGATGYYDFTFKNGVRLRACRVGIQAAGTQGGKTLFDGGDYYFDSLYFPCGDRDYASGKGSTSDTTLTNGAVMSVSDVTLAHRSNKVINLLLTGEGTLLESRGSCGLGSAGESHIDVLDGAELRLLAAGSLLAGAGQHTLRLVDSTFSWQTSFSVGTCQKEANVATSSATLAATNSIVSSPGYFSVENVGHVTVAGDDSKWNLGQFHMLYNTAYPFTGGSPSFTLEGGSVVVTNDIILYAVSAALNIRGGTFTAGRYLTIGNTSSADASLTVSGGTFMHDFSKSESIAADPQASVAYLGGYSTTSKGTLNVTGGEAKFNNIYAGWKGMCAINVSGGKLSIRSDLRLGNAALSDYEHTLTQTGGEIYAPHDMTGLGQTKNVKARVKLCGGKLSCKSFQAGNASPLRNSESTTGNVALEADGGTLVALVDSANFIRYFNSAEIKAGGLTIDTAGHALTIDQNFTGTGTLTLTGGGTVTFTAGNTVAGPIRVLGDTKVVFSGVAPGGLTLGDATGAAVLDLAAGTPVAVNGDFTLSNLTLTVSGLTIGTTADVFTVTGAMDDASKAKWAEIAVTVPDGAAYDAETVEAEGVKHVRLVVREPKDVPIVVPAETVETHATNITWRMRDRLAVTVGEGGEARFEGVLGEGWLVKDGLGTMTLANPLNTIYDGVKFCLGTINFDYPADDAVADWPLRLAATNRADELRFTSSKNVRLSNLDIVTAVGAQGTVAVATEKQIALDVPTTDVGYLEGALNVEEGEAKLSGTGSARVNIQIKSGVLAGVSGTGGSRSTKAGFVLDRVRFTGAVNLAYDFRQGNPVTESYLVISNGAELASGGNFFDAPDGVKWSDKDPNVRAWMLLDNATLSGTWVYNLYAKPVVVPKVTARNGSRITSSIQFRGGCDFEFDGSELASSILYFSNWQYTNNFAFVNGATCNVSVIRSGYSGWYDYPPEIGLTFDDSEFKGMDGDFGPHDPHLDPSQPTRVSNNPKVTVYAKGTGVKLDVPADTTYTWAYLLKDSPDAAGGFVKKGAGTLRVLKVRNRDYETYSDDFSFTQTGVTRVEAGTLDLNGNAWTGATLGGGAGVFSNGTVTATRLVPTFEGGVCTTQPRLASDCALAAGTVKVDVTDAGLEPDTQFVALTYAGTAPDVSKWRLTGDKSLKAKFTAAGGQVTATVVKKTGAVFYLR